MKMIDGDELKDLIHIESHRAYNMSSDNIGHIIQFKSTTAISLDELDKLIDRAKITSEHDAYMKLERERDEWRAKYIRLENELNSDYVNKKDLLDDIKEIIEQDLNTNGLTMTNEQLYDVLKTEIESPLSYRDT